MKSRIAFLAEKTPYFRGFPDTPCTPLRTQVRGLGNEHHFRMAGLAKYDQYQKSNSLAEERIPLKASRVLLM